MTTYAMHISHCDPTPSSKFNEFYIIAACNIANIIYIWVRNIILHMYEFRMDDNVE